MEYLSKFLQEKRQNKYWENLDLRFLLSKPLFLSIRNVNLGIVSSLIFEFSLKFYLHCK